LKNSNNKNKNILKPEFVIFLIIAVVFFASLLILFFSFRDLSGQIEKYSKNILDMSDNIIKLNEDFNRRNSKLTTAELLINNTNPILSTVYYGTADTEELQGAQDFTAFSLIYKDKFYVITAGHCVEMDGEKYKNFRFKSNDKDYFISLKLIDYKNDFTSNIDYAIFYDPNLIRSGLYPASPDEDQYPQYILGNLQRDLNFIKKYDHAKEGESGSPILNSSGHVVGILIKKSGAYTPISELIIALDRICD